MELQYYGGNCVRLSTKKANIIIDDNLIELGGKTVTKAGDIALFTGPHGEPGADVKLVIDQPGEYEVSDVSIQGVAARAHIDEEGKKSTVMYRLLADDIRIAVLGHIYPYLSDDQLESLGTIDILIIPVGGNGYTLDPVGALEVIKKIEPKIVIPTHYADGKLKYPVPAVSLEEAIKGLSMEPKETVEKLKVKGGELFGESTQLIVLNK